LNNTTLCTCNAWSLVSALRIADTASGTIAEISILISYVSAVQWLLPSTVQAALNQMTKRHYHRLVHPSGHAKVRISVLTFFIGKLVDQCCVNECDCVHGRCLTCAQRPRKRKRQQAHNSSSAHTCLYLLAVHNLNLYASGELTQWIQYPCPIPSVLCQYYLNSTIRIVRT
jgi:hypothetical protein